MSRFTVLAFAVGTLLGAVLLYLLLQLRAESVPAGWYDLVMYYKGPEFSTEAFTADIGLPGTTKISRKAKFLDSDQGGSQDITLGFIVNVSVDHLKTAYIPAKYKQSRKLGSITLLPTTEVSYLGDLGFDLKDADGFVLETLTSAPIDLRSGAGELFPGHSERADFA